VLSTIHFEWCHILCKSDVDQYQYPPPDPRRDDSDQEANRRTSFFSENASHVECTRPARDGSSLAAAPRPPHHTAVIVMVKLEELAADPPPTAPPAASALQDNLTKKMQSSYYYAHVDRDTGRGSHSFTSQLNLSALHGIGLRVGLVWPVFRGC